jgi:hypothetical protein
MRDIKRMHDRYLRDSAKVAFLGNVIARYAAGQALDIWILRIPPPSDSQTTSLLFPPALPFQETVSLDSMSKNPGEVVSSVLQALDYPNPESTTLRSHESLKASVLFPATTTPLCLTNPNIQSPIFFPLRREGEGE